MPGYDLCTGWGTPNGAALISGMTQGSPIITNPPAYGQLQFTDTNAGAPRGFYRVVIPGGVP